MAEKIYPYAVARIRVLEKNLLTKQTLHNMAEAKTPKDVLRILKDSGYGDDISNIDVHDYEKLLALELKKTYALMKELIPDENIFDIFLYKNDYLNLKILLKQEVSSSDGEKYLQDNGTIPLDKLKKYLSFRQYNELPSIIADAIKEALQAYSHIQNGQLIDLILDNAVYKQMTETASKYKNEFISELVEIMCDITNIKTFLRVRHMNKDFEIFVRAFLDYGSLKLDIFEHSFKAENPSQRFTSTRYGKLCEEGFGLSFTEFEKLCDNFQIEYIKKAKYLPLTIEPLVAYLFAREAEIKMARIIMTSKLNGINTEIIKERLRESYV